MKKLSLLLKITLLPLAFSFFPIITSCKSSWKEKDIPMDENYFQINDGSLEGFSSSVLTTPSLVKKFNTIRIGSTISSISSNAFSEGAIPSNIICLIFDQQSSVSQIPSSAFAFNVFLQRILLSSNITDIGDSAFKQCSSLNKIYLGDNLETIGSEAFAGCISLPGDEGDIAGDFLLPFSLEQIGDSAFKNCSNMQKLDIPGTVNSLSTSTFEGCSSLHSVFMTSVNTIPDRCFFGCSNLTNVNFSHSLSNIGTSAFELCYNFLPFLSTITSNLTIGSRSFFGCIETDSDLPDITSISIPANVVAIGANAFGSTGMTAVSIFWTNISAISNINSSAFSGSRSYGTLHKTNSVPSNVVNAILAMLPSGWQVE